MERRGREKEKEEVKIELEREREREGEEEIPKKLKRMKEEYRATVCKKDQERGSQ